MVKFVRKAPSHFIAINCHGFHGTERAILCAQSVLQSVRGLSGRVKYVFFYHSDQPVSPSLLTQLEDLGLEVKCFPSGPNGAGLNVQIAEAKNYDFFYRVDADDLVSEDRFRWQVEQFETTGCDISGGSLIYRNVKTGHEYQVVSPALPATMAFLMNQFFMHPTLAFRLSSFNKTNIRYGLDRMEDKGLAISAVKAGLKVVNDQRVYGVYNLNSHARNSRFFSNLNLKYNLAFIHAKTSYWAVFLALGIYLASLTISSERLRRIRRFLTRAHSPT